CGLIFISLSLVMSRYLLRTEEFWVVKKNAPLQVFALSMLSIGAFAAVGAEMVLSFTILWFVGSLVGGAVIMLFQKQRSAVNQS
ncbi:MAG: hypothetical protein KDD25_07470, partial [Bdellovibrionales bacterium]|nr:hypothetical protein [Bdellovibrionales bacterium]